jgi:hypothetical protein
MLQHAPPVAISNEEAEAVLELWASRRQEADAIRQMPTTHDLAEVLGTSEQEVMRMLQEVRVSKASTPIQAAQVPRKKRRWKWILGAVAVCGISFLSYAGGRSAGARFVGPSAFAREVAFSAQYNLPKGLSAEFRGYTISGNGPGGLDQGMIESELLDALGSVVAQQTPSPVAGHSMTLHEPEAILRSLRADKPEPGLEDAIAFEPILLRMDGNVSKVMIPIALSPDPQLTSLVQQEVDRRIRVAANKGARMASHAQSVEEATKS